MIESSHHSTLHTPHRDTVWFALAVSLVLAIALGMRFGTIVLATPATFDEPYIAAPITNILQQGWTFRTAIDFEETKGPGLIWLYAVAGEVVGGSLNDLRLISLALFVLGVVPLLSIARRCKLRGPAFIAIAGLYALLPYNAVLGQMVMSEPAFVLQMLVACWLFQHGIGDARGRLWAIILFTIALSILLHNRVHGVALAAAVCLIAFERGGVRGALPWVIACTVAGLSRLPLWAHWGGLVSPRFQGVHGLGVSFAGQTYLLATYAPLVAAFIIPAMLRDDCGRRRFLIALGAIVGLLLSVLAMPNLAQSSMFENMVVMQYAGVTATAIRAVTTQPLMQSILIGLLATIGGAGLGALATLGWSSTVDQTSGVIERLQCWLLAAGLAMYAASATPVYDRYALGWAILLPICWWTQLPRWLLIVQMIDLLAIAAILTKNWLL